MASDRRMGADSGAGEAAGGSRRIPFDEKFAARIAHLRVPPIPHPGRANPRPAPSIVDALTRRLPQGG